MAHITVRGALAALLLLPAGLAAETTVTTPAPPAAAPAAAAATGYAPRFSEPTYLPLRDPARVSCVKDNCRLPDGRVYHGDWAIDFIGNFGDPVHAAGYGIAYVGGRVSGCRDRGNARGNWVWIDHGGGELTKYYHLQKIHIRNGQQVTPDTKIGEMSGTGGAQCKLAYLHFERLVTNRVSQHIQPATMWACIAGQPVGYPQANGFPTWNMPKLQQWVRSGSLGCLKRPPRAGHPILVSAGSNAARDGVVMKWLPPAQNAHLVTRYRVFVALWHPTTGEWDANPAYYTVPTNATTFTVPGLQPKRTYRVKIAAADRAGASPWSDSRDVILAKPPAAPPITQLKSTKRTVYAKWTIPPNGGNRITSYSAVLRRGTAMVRQSRLSPKVRNVTWTGLARKTRYTAAVVAVNKVGPSQEALRRVSTK